jgi:casein kinase I family protein HRR25
MGYDTTSGEDVAIKLELQSSKHLENEYTIYKAIGNHISVPYVKWFGVDHDRKALVLSLLGPSLEKLFVASRCNFKLKTILAIADQLVCLIPYYIISIVLIFLHYKIRFLI